MEALLLHHLALSHMMKLSKIRTFQPLFLENLDLYENFKSVWEIKRPNKNNNFCKCVKSWVFVS